MTIRQPIVTVCGHVDHGKCVAGDTLIPLIDGSIISAKELFEENFDLKKSDKIDDGFLQDVNSRDIWVFSFDGRNIINKKISHIWKRKASKLIEIRLASGDIIKTTPEHPFFILDNLNIKEKKAEEIAEREYIAIPKKIISNDSDIILDIIIKLKEISNFICFLNKNSERLIGVIRKNNIQKLERILKIKNLNDSVVKKRFRIKDFFILTSYLGINDKEAYFMIESIKNAKEDWRVGHTSKAIFLPNLNEPEKLGYILGCLAGDGHVSKRAVLNNNDSEIQEAYISYLKEVFNIESKVSQGHTCQIVQDKGGLTFARFLFDIIGFPKKNKSAEIFVPEIAKKNRQIFRGFFSGWFDTDGYVSHLNNSIEITSKSKKLVKECSILLLNFGIHSVVSEKNGFYVLRIANKIYLNKFLENFNPRLKRKLNRVINASLKAETSRVFDFLPISGKILSNLKFSGKINKQIPFFSKYKKSDKISSWLLRKALENIRIENETSNKIKEIIEQDLTYVEVISKKEIENKENYVYDFTVPDTHNFIAERVLVHNTSILDKIRGTSVAAAEAGGITQKISFTLFPAENIRKGCSLLDKRGYKLDIPGFLFIDTPGHAAFTNLRKRGGSLADLAILVIDINEGIKPQTAEVLSILKANKTPFIIALNKIDNISGWRKQSDDLKESIEKQAIHTKQNFDEKFYTFQASLNSYGFNSDLFFNVTDFTKKIILVPLSAKTGEGVQELLMMLCGLSQRFLKERLNLAEKAKGVILEIKKEKNNEYLECIIYDGKLKQGDEIAIASFNEPIIAKIRNMEEIQPLSFSFKSIKEAKAATGIRVQLCEKADILPGMPFQIFKNNMKEIEKEFKKDVSESIKTNSEGIIIKSESLGSLEALLVLLKQENINVLKAGIGNISKQDILQAKANLESNPENAVVLGFNSVLDEDAAALAGNVKVITHEVVYKLIDDLKKYQEEKRKEIEREKLLGMASVFKIEILHNFVFHNSKPAVFGVRVLAGKLKPNIDMIDNTGEKIGRIKNIQEEKNSLDEAGEGKEVAISVPGVTFDRQLKDTQFLYSDMGEKQFRNLKDNKELLSPKELSALQEIAQIKRKEKAGWGM